MMREEGRYAVPQAVFFQAEDGIRDDVVTGVQTCALPISSRISGSAGAKIAARGAGNPRGGAGIDAGKLGDNPFHRAAWRELNYREGHQHDPEQGRDHEKNATDDVSSHLVF